MHHGGRPLRPCCRESRPCQRVCRAGLTPWGLPRLSSCYPFFTSALVFTARYVPTAHCPSFGPDHKSSSSSRSSPLTLFGSLAAPASSPQCRTEGHPGRVPHASPHRTAVQWVAAVARQKHAGLVLPRHACYVPEDGSHIVHAVDALRHHYD